MVSNKHWIQNAIKRPGAFSAKAKRAGVSVKKFAQMKKNSPNSTLAKEANLSLTLGKLRGRK